MGGLVEGRLATFSLLWISFLPPFRGTGITDVCIKLQYPLFCLLSGWDRQGQGVSLQPEEPSEPLNPPPSNGGGG